MDKQNEILKKEEEILREEGEILKEEKETVEEERKILRLLKRNLYVTAGAAAVIVVGFVAGFSYWQAASSRVYIENSFVEAPQIELAPQNSGILKDVFVNEGDFVEANAPVAQIGSELIKTQIAGEIISVNRGIGKIFNPGEAAVTMIDPNELRAVGRLDEDKGLADIRVGDRAVFTVDAFGGKEYIGTVSEISPTSRQSDVVFNISNERQVRQFDVKIIFDIKSYPELKNGMSAKIWVYKN